MSGANVTRTSERVFSVRASAGRPLGGMRPDLSPDAIPPTDFVYLENVRRVGGAIVSRGGQVDFHDASSEVLGMTDFRDFRRGRVLLSAGDGTLYTYCPGDSPHLQLLDTTAVTAGKTMCPRGAYVSIESSGELPGFSGYVFGEDIAEASSEPAVVYRVDFGDAPQGLSRSGFSYSPLFKLPTVDGVTYNAVKDVLQFEGYVFIMAAAVDIGAGSSSLGVFKWDTQTLSLEVAWTGTGSPNDLRSVGLFQFRDSVVAITADNGAANQLQLRTRAAAGTWSAVTYVGTFNVGGGYYSWQHDAAVSFQDNLYILNEDLFMKWDGSSITEIMGSTGIHSEAADGVIQNVVVLNGYLYYQWIRNDGEGGLTVGRFDGATWDATYTAINQLFSNQLFIGDVESFHPMIAYGRALALVMSTDQSDQEANVGFWCSQDDVGIWPLGDGEWTSQDVIGNPGGIWCSARVFNAD